MKPIRFDELYDFTSQVAYVGGYAGGPKRVVGFVWSSLR